MSKTKKYFFLAWAAITIIFALAAWIQTNRLGSASSRLELTKRQTIATLVDEAQKLLDSASDQVAQRNLGMAEAQANSALVLVTASMQVIEEEKLAQKITDEIKTIKAVRGAIIAGDEKKTASGDLKREASELRKIKAEM